MRLIDHDYDLPVQIVLQVVIPVFDDLIVNILKYQQHLGICDGGVPVCQQ